MVKKVLAVSLTLLLLLACALPAFAMTAESAQAVVESKLWLANEETQYTITDEGVYHQVIAIDHGVTYVFQVKNTDGTIRLDSYKGEETETSSKIATYIGVLNACILQLASLFVVF